MSVADIVLSTWFLPGYVGLIVGMAVGIAISFAAENWVQSGVAKMRKRMGLGYGGR